MIRDSDKIIIRLGIIFFHEFKNKSPDLSLLWILFSTKEIKHLNNKSAGVCLHTNDPPCVSDKWQTISTADVIKCIKQLCTKIKSCLKELVINFTHVTSEKKA